MSHRRADSRAFLSCFAGHDACSEPIVYDGCSGGERFVPDDPPAESKARIRAAIIRHLTRYPLAGDTTEGMITCWMPLERGEALRFVEEVVNSMVVSGELLAQQLPDGRILYKRGPRI